MKRLRILQLTVLLLVAVAAVQAGFWVFDQDQRAAERRQDLERLYAQQQATATALLAGGWPQERVVPLFPDLDIVDGRVHLAAAREDTMVREQQQRMRQYLWEGGFFFVVLCAGIAVIWTGLRAEARVLDEQEQFLALVSHQFKTPLASLQLSIETLSLRQLEPVRAKALLDRMLSDLERMSTMVGQILDSARLSRGKVDFRSVPVALAETVERVVGHYLERAQTDRITIETHVPAQLAVLADPIAVDAVVRNVLENALAAVAPVGGGTVSLSARQTGDEVELVVKDSGIGFQPQDQAQLFRKFSRLNAGAGSRYYGTGLGLFIVTRLMQLAGGRVSASRAGAGQGAEFVLSWPCVELA
jgi:signal transduction histidine kinase